MLQGKSAFIQKQSLSPQWSLMDSFKPVPSSHLLLKAAVRKQNWPHPPTMSRQTVKPAEGGQGPETLGELGLPT